MSGLIFMMLLKVESELKDDQINRLFLLSMIAMDSMRSGMRLYLRKRLILKCKLIKEPEGKRKKLIWSKREAKAKENGKKWKERVERKLEKTKISE